MIKQTETAFGNRRDIPISGATIHQCDAVTSSSGNPYAATNGPGNFAAMRYPTYPKADQSGLVWAFGILAWFVCPIFGIVAWVMGRTALQDVAAGLADPANKGLLLFGTYLGMVNVILYGLCFGGYIVFAALAITLGWILAS